MEWSLLQMNGVCLDNAIKENILVMIWKCILKSIKTLDALIHVKKIQVDKRDTVLCMGMEKHSVLLHVIIMGNKNRYVLHMEGVHYALPLA